MHAKPFGLPFQLERNLVTVLALQTETVYGIDISETRSVVHFHCEGCLGRNSPSLGAEAEEAVVELGNAAPRINGKGSRHFSTVSEDDFSACSTSHQHSSEVYLADVAAEIGILPHC